MWFSQTEKYTILHCPNPSTFFRPGQFSDQGWRKIHFRNVYWNRLLWCFLFVGERFSMYLMLFVDRLVRFSVVLWTDHSEWYIVLWIVHSDFMLCCGSITRNDILWCGSFTPILWCFVARSRGMIYSVVIVRSFFKIQIYIYIYMLHINVMLLMVVVVVVVYFLLLSIYV